MPQYLDENGNPIQGQKTYLDPNTGEPIKEAAPAEKSLLQKAKDNFNAATSGPKPGQGALVSALEKVGQGGGDAVRGAYHALTNPAEAVKGFTESVTPDLSTKTGVAEALLGPAGKPIVETAKSLYQDPLRTVGSMGAGAILGEAAGAVVGPAAEMAKRGAGKVALLGKTPEAAYESALKPSTALPAATRDAVIKTGLEQGIPISKGGLEKLTEKIQGLNQAIKDEISSDPNRPIDPNKVATRANAAKSKFANQVNAKGDLNAIDASQQQFLNEQGAQPGTAAQPTGILDAQGNPIMRPAQPPSPAPPMGAADAQAMKQGTYRVLKGKFGEQGSASVEAQKALARGLKEEIATQFPEIAKLNATESKLLDLQPVLERAVNRISNHQAIGIGTPVAGAAAEAVTGSGGVGVVASVLKGVLDNPSVKSRLAIAISKSSKIPYSQALKRVQGYSVSLGATAGSSPGENPGDTPDQSSTQQP